MYMSALLVYRIAVLQEKIFTKPSFSGTTFCVLEESQFATPTNIVWPLSGYGALYRSSEW